MIGGPRRLLLVGNPSAQSGRAHEVLDAALEGLRRRGRAALLVHTESHGRTVGAVRDAIARERPDVVVYLGGDGTFNEVARGILASSQPLPLGMLPMGTANDQGRSFGIRPGAEALDENLDTIVVGHVTHLDAGRLEALRPDGHTSCETLFFDSAGWGLQPDILATRNRDRALVSQIPLLRDLYRDQAVYAGATLDRLLASLLEPTKFDAVIVADGRNHQYEGLTDLIVKGTAVYGGEWVLDRRSEPDDGLMELVPITGRRDWASKAIRDLVFFPFTKDDLEVVGITHSEGFSAASMELSFFREGGDPIPSQVDGEEWDAGDRFRVTVLPRALAVITPAGFVPPWKE